MHHHLVLWELGTILCCYVSLTADIPLYIGVIRMNPPSASEWALFWIAKIFHVLMVLVIPYFYMSLGKLVALTE